MYKCRFGECDHFNEQTGECKRQSEIAAMSPEEMLSNCMNNKCSLREWKVPGTQNLSYHHIHYHIDNRVMAEYFGFSFIIGYLEGAKEWSRVVDPSVLLSNIEEFVAEKEKQLNEQYPDTARK